MKTINKLALILITGCGLAIWGTGAIAGQASGTLGESATVTADCSITSTTLAFGNFDPTLGTADDQTANFTVICTNGAPVSLGLDGGGAGAAAVTARVMSDGSGHTLPYTLSQDSGHSTNWGNTAGTDTVDINGTGASQSTTIYGEVPADPTAHKGTYSDTINMYAYF